MNSTHVLIYFKLLEQARADFKTEKLLGVWISFGLVHVKKL